MTDPAPLNPGRSEEGVYQFVGAYGEIMGASGSVCHNSLTPSESGFEDRLRQLNL